AHRGARRRLRRAESTPEGSAWRDDYVPVEAGLRDPRQRSEGCVPEGRTWFAIDRRSRRDAEGVHHDVPIRLAGPEDHLVPPGRNVDRVREHLRLEAQTPVLDVGGDALTQEGALEDVPRVELVDGLIGGER